MTEETKNSTTNNENTKQIRELTAKIIAAGVTAGTISLEQVPHLIKQISKSFYDVGKNDKKFIPAVSIKESLEDENYIISMIDGSRHKIMGPHLKKNGLTPNEYRHRFGLPETYPMTAQNYSKKRSELAQKIGLGKQRNKN